MDKTPPILLMPVYTADAADRAQVRDALTQIARSDTGILVLADPDSEGLLYSGASLEHLQATFNTITGKYQIPAWKGEPRVRYLETISKSVEAEGKYIRQTGGSGNYGHVKLRLEANEPDQGFAFANEIRGGVIPQQYVPAIENAVRQAARNSTLAGLDMKVVLFDGSFHEIDSNELAFCIAAASAFREAEKKARPVLLEPVMSVVFTALESQGSTLFSEVNRRNGRIEDVRIRDVLTVRAKIPLQQMLSWSGPGSYVMLFSAYEPVPHPNDRADETGIPARRPGGPSPKSDSAAAKPDWDWT